MVTVWERIVANRRCLKRRKLQYIMVAEKITANPVVPASLPEKPEPTMGESDISVAATGMCGSTAGSSTFTLSVE